LESDWRWNVADQGLAGWGIEMCARILNPTPFFQWVYKGVGPLTFRSAGNHGIFPNGQMYLASAGYSGPLNFPYGFEVEPDHT